MLYIKRFGFSVVAACAALLSVAPVAQASLFATGGEESLINDGAFAVHSFTNSGTFTLTGNMIVRILAVGGGGGGGAECGGGGGGGGVVASNEYQMASGVYTVTIGAGGIGGMQGTDRGNGIERGGQGGDTTISDASGNVLIRAYGGGGGGGWSNRSGIAGGSGGGAAATGTGGATLDASQGNAAGDANGGNRSVPSGGGGAGAASATTTLSANIGGISGAGGSGFSSDITGTTQSYGAGGGGGNYSYGSATAQAAGGDGLGGFGQGNTATLQSNMKGRDGFGGGGGGGSNASPYIAGDGGCGAVIICIANTAGAASCVEVSSFGLADLDGGSTVFTHSTTVGIVDPPTVASANAWQLTSSADRGSIDPMAWQSTPPSSFSFLAPQADADVSCHLWITNTMDAAYILRHAASDTIRYTTTAPSVVAADYAATMFAGRTASVTLDQIADGTTGGTSAGTGLDSLAIPLEGLGFSLVSGLGSNLSDDPETITVGTAGQYTIRVAATNEAGNVAFADATFTVTAIANSALTWTGAVSTNFYDTANWLPAIIPESGDEVVIPSGTPFNLNLEGKDYPESGAFASFTVAAGATVVALGDTTAINEAAGGTASVPYGRGPVVTAGDISVSGTITADGNGFVSGPGRTLYGASHGGAGDMWSSNQGFPAKVFNVLVPPASLPYGNALAPTELGSAFMGRGGGAIKLVASGDIAIEGTVSANGYRGASGGSVWIVAGGNLSGAGTIAAKGYCLNGIQAGGRIRLDYATSDFSGTVSAWTDGWNDNQERRGSVGTVYDAKRYPVGTADEPANVTVTDPISYVFPDDGIVRHWNLTIDGAKQVEFHGGKLVLHALSISEGSSLTFAKWNIGCEDDMKSLDILCDVNVPDSAMLQLPGAGAIPVIKLANVTVAVGGTLAVGRGDATFVNEDAGGTSAIPLGRGTTLRCRSANIAGSLSATGMGFGYKVNPENTGNDYGTAHGGATPYHTKNVWKDGYGHFTRPIELGGCLPYNNMVIYGGGAIRLEVEGELAVSGTICVDGHLFSRASGGSLWIKANRISGNGYLTAYPGTHSRYGGGGRIAVEAKEWAFDGAFGVEKGQSPNNNKSFPGTVFTNVVCNSTALGLDSGAPILESSYAKEIFNANIATWEGALFGGQAFLLSRRITEWKPRRVMAWTEGFSLMKDGTPVANTGTYVISGLNPGQRATVTENGVSRYVMTDSEGVLTFETELQAGNNDISVALSSGMMIIMR